MTETEILASELEAAHSGEPWHGPSCSALLAGVTAAEAARRPPGGAHTIWELVLHLTGWTGEVAQRLHGKSAGAPPQGDWPTQPRDATDRAWADARADLDAAHRALVDAVHAFPDARLGDIVPDPRPAPEGGSVTYGTTIRGVLQHLAYHSGQMAILKRIVSGEGSTR
ncbi:MAG TPA: DinB family protein [Gemmatimonadaceae bacterium]|nr:DinB family protein [Gemmatimonadaceae bacterium]